MTTRDSLIQELTQIQNRPENRDRDIMTFSGFMETDEKLAQYVALQRGSK